MSVYWVTIAGVGFMLLMARLLDPELNQRSFGELPNQASSRIFIGLAAAGLVVVGALRWGVGTDFYTYVRNYDAYKTSFWSSLLNFDEPGVKFVALLTSVIFDDAALFMAISAVITIGLLLYATTKYSIAVEMSYLLFIFVGVWHGTFNGLRQFMACAILFVAHRFITDRKFFKYLIVVLLAASFHISALAMLVLYLVPNRRLGMVAVGSLVVLVVIGLYGSGFVFQVVESIRGDLEETPYVVGGVNPLRVAVAVLPVLLYWTPGVRTDADQQWFYRNMIIIHAVIMLAATTPYLARFAFYSMAFLPLALPRLVDFPNRRITILARVSVVVMFFAFWYVEVAGSSSLRQYDFMFDSDTQRVR